MRRIERIDEILAIIRKKWLEVPDQRLGQLLENYFHYPRGDIFFVEDDVFGVEVFDKNSIDPFTVEKQIIKNFMKKERLRKK